MVQDSYSLGIHHGYEGAKKNAIKAVRNKVRQWKKERKADPCFIVFAKDIITKIKEL